MAKPVLPTDFKDDVLAESMKGKRRYRVVQNPDGTIFLDDVTEYDQIGSTFGAKQVNDMATAINAVQEIKIANNDTTTEAGFAADARIVKVHGDEIDALSRDLGRVNVYVGGDGKLHFVNSGGADSVLPFNNKPTYYVVSTGRELAVRTYAESSVKITIPDKEGKTVVGGYITNIRVYNSNGNLEEAPIRCNYANKVLTVISSAGKWSSGWTAYYFDVVGIYI